MSRLMAIGVGLAQGAEKATATMLGVMEAKYKLKQNEELLNLKKKAIEKDDTLLPFQKAHYTSQIDNNKAHIAYYSKMATLKEEEAAEKKRQAEKGLDTINTLIANNPDIDWQYNSGTGATTIRNKSAAATAAQSPTRLVEEKVMKTGVESLTPGEKAIWDKANRSASGFDPFGQLGSAGGQGGGDDWWNK